MSDLLEGWSYPVTETVPYSPLKILDHTFVKAPKGAFFNCFGGHHDKGERKLDGASGYGSYAIANCYREPLGPMHDTAGLGVYATCGVCHQAANRFLWSACGTFSGPTIKNAHAYILSWSFYGTYGRPQGQPWTSPSIDSATNWAGIPPTDFQDLYKKCSAKGTLLSAEPPSGVDAAPLTGVLADAAARAEARIIALHRELHAAKQALGHNAIADAELKIVTEEHLGPDFDHTKIQEIRGRALNSAQQIATSDLRGAAYALAVNEVAVQYLQEMEAHLGSDLHSKFFGIPAGERYGVVDPALAEQAGTKGTRA